MELLQYNNILKNNFGCLSIVDKDPKYLVILGQIYISTTDNDYNLRVIKSKSDIPTVLCSYGSEMEVEFQIDVDQVYYLIGPLELVDNPLIDILKYTSKPKNNATMNPDTILTYGELIIDSIIKVIENHQNVLLTFWPFCNLNINKFLLNCNIPYKILIFNCEDDCENNSILMYDENVDLKEMYDNSCEGNLDLFYEEVEGYKPSYVLFKNKKSIEKVFEVLIPSRIFNGSSLTSGPDDIDEYTKFVGILFNPTASRHKVNSIMDKDVSILKPIDVNVENVILNV